MVCAHGCWEAALCGAPDVKFALYTVAGIQYTVRTSHQVCHTKPPPNTHEHIQPELLTPDTAPISGPHKRATAYRLNFTHRHTHHTCNPQQPPTKTAPAKRKKTTSTHSHTMYVFEKP